MRCVLCIIGVVYETEITNGELNNVFLWLNSNKLSLNVKKTQFMAFSLKKHIIANTKMCINNQIDRVEHTTFPGVILDSHLIWSYHIFSMLK